MKKVLLGTLAVLTLAACSKDEVIQQNPNDEISFSVVTNKAISRAENGFCNNHTPARFVVSASYTSDGSTFKQYFLNDKFKKNGSDENGKEYVAFETNRYWPDLSGANTSVTFYAATDGPKVTVPATWADPISVLPTWQKDGGGNTIYTGMEILGYTVEDVVANQRDLLYAVEKVTANPTGGQQSLNFRHALSQIEFMAKNENPNIYVEISQVKVCQVNSKGDFTFPKSTSDKIGVHNGGAGYPDPATNKVGTWGNRSTLANYETAAITAVPLSERKYDGASLKTPTEAADASSLTTDNDPSKEYSSNTMYLLPQKFEASTGTDPDLTNVWSGSGKPETGAYFMIMTKIQNVAAGDGTRATSDDVYLWGSSSEAKYIAVPIPEDTNWEPGKRYVYTFKFTKTGNGGTDPDKGSPVLIPIKLDITVDDFVDGGDKDVEMKK